MRKTDLSIANRSPVHVVYGGAHLFKADTPQKLGTIALASVAAYAADVNTFASAMGLDESKIFLRRVYKKTLDKVSREGVEDFRIDFLPELGPTSQSARRAIRCGLLLLSPFARFRRESTARLHRKSDSCHPDGQYVRRRGFGERPTEFLPIRTGLPGV